MTGMAMPGTVRAAKENKCTAFGGNFRYHVVQISTVAQYSKLTALGFPVSRIGIEKIGHTLVRRI